MRIDGLPAWLAVQVARADRALKRGDREYAKHALADALLDFVQWVQRRRNEGPHTRTWRLDADRHIEELRSELNRLMN